MKLLYSESGVSIYDSSMTNFSKSSKIVDFDPNDLFLEVGFGDTTEDQVKKFIQSFGSKKKQIIDELQKGIDQYASPEFKLSSDLLEKTSYLGAIKVSRVLKTI